MEIKNGLIENVDIVSRNSKEGITVFLHIEVNIGEQRIIEITLEMPDEQSKRWLYQFMYVAGATSLWRCIGKTVRLMYLDEKIIKLGHSVLDNWFNFWETKKDSAAECGENN